MEQKIFTELRPLYVTTKESPKQSKKEQKKYHARSRRDWNGLKPATRVVKAKKCMTERNCVNPKQINERRIVRNISDRSTSNEILYADKGLQ